MQKHQILLALVTDTSAGKYLGVLGKASARFQMMTQDSAIKGQHAASTLIREEELSHSAGMCGAQPQLHLF